MGLVHRHTARCGRGRRRVRHADLVAHPDLTLDLGTLTRPALVEALRTRGIGLNEHAEYLLAGEVFDAPVRRSVAVTVLSVGDLGCPRGARLDQILTAVESRGWALCPPDTGPYLRLAMTDQASAPDSILSTGRAPTGAITVASRPPSEDDAVPKGFYLRTIDGRPWLRGYRCDATYLWSPDDRFAVQRPSASP